MAWSVCTLPNINSMATRLTASLGLAFGLGFVFTPLGCGSSPMGNPRPSRHASGDGPSVPAATVTALEACAEHGAGRLKGTHYAILFDVDVMESGEVREAKIRESEIGDREIETCMEHALQAMSLPGVVTPLRSSALEGVMLSPHARGAMGNVVIVGPAVSLVPVLIVAAGVTIIVVVTAHAVEETAEAIKKWPRKVEEKCRPLFDQCLDNQAQPDWNRRTFGEKKSCLDCLFACRKDEGQWPNYKCPPPGWRPN
ncbi:hypothetical protein [Polyangium jinanense]|uniref:Uncharacterized protein n=1 Tax=Polyangium jinanense TaxID=2829994 RepID=A0A9X3XDI0_9BACT|nr:hypothetical protein [Polyangium jinanense]MDC3961427.1 hypothetical protein [Polyangium jinanense]MDC3987028.1 hypothetical protein [Polyangium jinanense]